MERGHRESPTKRLCNNLSLLVRQFLLLLGKNFLLQIRRPIGTAFEVIIPIIAVAVLVAFRLAIPSLGTTKQCFQTFGSDPITIPTLSPGTVFYAPNDTNEVRELSEIIASMLNQSNIELVGVATEEEFISLIADGDESGFCGNGVGIYFNDLNSSNIQYTIRMNPNNDWNTNAVIPVFLLDGARDDDSPYFKAGFMQLEKLVDEAIIEWKTGSPFIVDVSVRQFPYPDYNQNFFLQILQTVLPLFFVLSLMFSVGVFIKELVLEKECRMKETMKMMGLGNWTLVSTWFIKQMLFYLGPMIIMTVLLKFGKIYPRSDFFLLFIVLLFYYMTSVAFSFFISVWFSSARLGLFAGFILWFLFFFPYFFIQPRYATLTFGTKLGTSLISNVCIGYAIQVLTVLEVQEDGLQFSNLFTPLSTDDSLSMGWILLMMIVDTVLYMSLYWYIDAVKPGKYGTPKPFYFMFLPSFWCGSIVHKKVNPDDIKAYTNPLYDDSAHESEPANSQVGVAIDCLTKIFDRLSSRNRKVAVDNLSLNMYKGQITALLGHNGAGKTTTMSILTGLFTPTTGNAYINGYSVLTEMDLIRRSLGICPQHNVLFDRLTVYEHLAFFSMLKGMATNKVKTEVNQMIVDLQLADKRSIQAKKLSGGMKRKLSVGIALVGQSEVVILDEPTSGMDPYARRATWDLLLKHKEGRTILLTTHFMDEADLLGDRIAIMAEGRLKCSGSSLFLKSKFGIGYHMAIVKEPGCDSRKIIDIVKGMVEGSSEVTDVGAELTFILPTQSRNQFPNLFDIFEKEKAELGISSFGVSITTMEEVFIKVGHGDDIDLESTLLKSQSRVDQSVSVSMERSKGVVNTALEDRTNIASEEGESSYLLQEEPSVDVTMKPVGDNNQYEYGTLNRSPSYQLNTGLILWFQQIYAIFLKHLYHAIRFWASIIWQLVIPLAFVILSLVLVVTQPGNDNNNPGRVLSLRNSAPSKTIDFFWASLGGVSSPFTFEENNASSLGISSLYNFTRDIDQIKQQVSNYTSTDQCCDYQYQILDKFCASRTVSDYYSECKDRSSFSFKTCSDCLSCSTDHLEPDTTCTSARYSNYYYGSYGCPVSPPLSYADLQNGDLSGPLEDYDTFVAEKLLDISGDYLNPNAFFNRYQGGFVVHPETYTYSICACPTSTDICALLSPTLKYNYPTNNFTNFTERSLEYYGYDISCSELFDTSDPDCSSDENWNYEYNWAVDSCIPVAQSSSCSDCNDISSCNQYVGSVAETFSTSAQPKVTIWYNNQPFHMAPAVLNSFYSLYLKQNTNVGNTITVTNKPLPKKANEQVDDTIDGGYGLIVGYIAVFGTCFLFSSFIIFLIQERESKAKHIQFVSGVGTTSYWIGTFLFDILNVLIPTILILIIFASFNVEGFQKENLAAIFLLFFLSSWAAIPICYIFSFLFTNSLIAFAILIMFHYFVFLVLQTTMFLVSLHDQKILYYVFLLHPTFGLGNGLTAMYNNQVYKDTCTKSPIFEQICKENGYTYLDSIFSFERPGINYTFIYLFLEGIVFFVITLLIERQFLIPEMRRLVKYMCGQKKQQQYDIHQSEPNLDDDDVVMERNRVHAMEQVTDEEVVVIKDLRKVYKGVIPYLCRCTKKYKRAVNGINLAIPNGECFGLLGVNGAGKTTTFNILTGDLSATSGSATIAGYDISTQLHDVQKRIGYCPQFDAIIDLLTGRELLTMFARLRGIPEKHIKNAVQFEIERLDLVKHANKRCGNYSGGNKRKLSTAIALIGNPPILFLDEPTTGMDPVTRRFLWDALVNIVHEGRSVILTSHSMEECEALCSRLAIMVNGQFKCLGSTQHLKSKYGSGYTMELRVSNVQTHTTDDDTHEAMTTQLPSVTPPIGHGNTYAIKAFIAAEFPGSLLLEEHQDSVTYRIPSEGARWSSMFRKIENNKERFGIINYSVSQTTLDQVFINFAKEQEISGVDMQQ